MKPNLTGQNQATQSLFHWANYYSGMAGKAVAVAFTASLYTRRLSPPTPTDVAKKFFGDCDRKLYGSRFYDRAGEIRVQGFLAAEDWTSHPHVHGAIFLPDRKFLSAQEQFDFLRTVWRKTYPGGDVNVSLLDTPELWLAYATKKSVNREDEIMHAFDFWK